MTTTNGEPKITATIDIRTIPHQERHPRIFKTFDGLQPGQALLLVVDHDPKPLYFQFDFAHKGRFSWDYLEEGPQLWRIRITKAGQAAGPARG